MSIVNAVPLLEAAGGDYTISRSVRLRSSASAYFNRTFSTPTNALKFTWSGWVKRGSLGAQMIFGNGNVNTGSTFSGIYFDSADRLYLYDAGSFFIRQTNAVYRDPSAWYHIFFSVDKTTTVDVKLYVNGVQVTSFADSRGTLLTAGNFNSAVATTIGKNTAASDYYFDGYLTEVNFIDGQALTPSSFGENDTITGVWKPKRYTGTYGTNGFYLNFSDNSNNTAATIGKDSSGNGNNWTPNNISVTAGTTYDSMTDVPTLTSATAANYCVLNPLATISGYTTTTNGNLTANFTNAGNGSTALATTAISSGKWYWEIYVTAAGTHATLPEIGIADIRYNYSAAAGATYLSGSPYGYVYQKNGNKANNGTSSTYGASWTTGNVIGVALDMDAGTLTFYKDNASQGTAYTGISGTFYPAADGYASSGTVSLDFNFGQRPFAYTPPTGFKALNTQNLPDATIKRGNDYFDIVTRAGTGASAAISSYRFAPDFVWIKARTNAYYHKLLDKVRGANKPLVSNATDAEATETQGLMSFDTSGYTLGSSSDSTVNNSGSGQTYVDWAWKAGGTAVSNTAGSITSSVSAGVSQGFSVVQFTATGSNATVGHGLGVAPAMVIVKDAASVGNWAVYHKSLTSAAYYLYMNTTAAQANVAAIWNNTAPTSTVFSVGTWHTADRQIAYCFAEVAGYSKFGSYTGNGSTDGPFVYCGFRPRWVMIKLTSSSGGSWIILDTARDTYNTETNALFPNLSDAESSGYLFDGLSNGFKVRNAGSGQNSSGATYIYAAFAEVPFRSALAR